MNNRLPYYILGVLVLVALIWRVANPPKPPIPGPLGAPPNWSSMTKVGDMGPWSVNPAGTKWAGAWNQKTRDGKLRSSIWVVDFTNKEAKPCEMEDGSYVSSLDWQDNTTIRALVLDSDNPSAADKSRVVLVDSVKRTASDQDDLNQPVSQLLGCSPRAAEAAGPATAALLTDKSGRANIAVLDGNMNVAGKPTPVDVPESARPGRIGAVDPARAEVVVFSMAEGEVGGNDVFYLADAKAGTIKQVFRAEDIPGRVEGIWVSPEGILLVVSERDKLHRMVYDSAKGELREVKPGTKLRVSKTWPDAPKSMMFVTYNAGYDLNLETGRAKRLFDLTKLDRDEGYWREQVQDGRLYPRKGDGYTSVSVIANAVDIRAISKDGSKVEPILPRR